VEYVEIEASGAGAASANGGDRREPLASRFHPGVDFSVDIGA